MDKWLQLTAKLFAEVIDHVLRYFYFQPAVLIDVLWPYPLGMRYVREHRHIFCHYTTPLDHRMDARLYANGVESLRCGVCAQ